MSSVIEVKALKPQLKEEKISLLNSKLSLSSFKNYFTSVSGGKTIVLLKRAGIVFGGSLLFMAVIMAWFGPKEDKTFFVQSNQPQKSDEKSEIKNIPLQGEVVTLLDNGRKKMINDQKVEALKKQQRIVVKYSAPQLVGVKGNSPKAIQSGAKLVGFLLNSIDTRSQSTVRVRISQGGEMSGVEIERGSILSGQFSYPGSGDKLFLNFMMLETPDGEPKKVQAQALDSGTFTVGITGEEHSEKGTKVAASLGLSMFSGMADVLTEKESLGPAQNGVQAKSTMKNALLQGLSRSAQDQTGRMASDIGSAKDYLTVPVGQEMIIELTQDFK